MKNTKLMKIIPSVLVVLMLVLFTNTVFAGMPTPDQMTGTYNDVGDIKNLGNSVIGIITTIGIVVSVLVLVILGIKYMIGSASEKAEYKKTMIPYIIGAILVFAASTIATMVMNIAGNIG